VGDALGDAVGDEVGDALGDELIDAVGGSVCELVSAVLGDVVGVSLLAQKSTLATLPKSLPDNISVSPSVTLKDPVPYPQQIPSPYESLIVKT